VQEFATWQQPQACQGIASVLHYMDNCIQVAANTKFEHSELVDRVKMLIIHLVS
jgi:hypothetical protein